MSQSNFEKIKERYNGISNSPKKAKKEFNIPGKGNRLAALGASGKPKDLKNILKRLFNYLINERSLLIISLICVIIQATAALTASYMLRPIINKFIYYDGNDISGRVNGLIIGLIFMSIVYIVSVFTQWLSQRLMLIVSQRALKKMRQDLMSKLQTLPIRYYDTHSAGDIMSRFTNDIDAIGDMLSNTLSKIISGIITIVGSIILMLYTSWVLGLITIILTPLLIYISKTVIKKSKTSFKAQQINLGILGGFVEETISGQKVVKTFNHEQIAIEEFDLINEELSKSQINAQFRSSILGPLTHQLCNIIYAVSSCVGGLLIVKKGFDIGGMAVSLNFTRRFNKPINEISMQINVVMSSLAGAERVFEVLDTPSEENNGKITNLKNIKGNVNFNNVTFGYEKNVTVLNNISLKAKQGQKIAFVGSTGAGKTTITNLLTRFYEISNGEITIDDIPINSIDKNTLRKNIAMVLQDTHLFSGTIRENIRYGNLDASDDEVEKAAKIANAHLFISKLSNGYDTILENDGANLSQGQRQLLNIARAMISDAPILVLDEATSSVDTRTEKYIEKGMDALMKNRTTFIIAHRLSTVINADLIIVLEKGNIIESGTHNELLKLKGKYYQLYNEIIELD